MKALFRTQIKTSKAKGITGNIALDVEVYSVTFTADGLVVSYAIYLPGLARYQVKEDDYLLSISEPLYPNLLPILTGIESAFNTMVPLLIEEGI